MERGRVTVEYNYLPGQVFEHETEGLYCVVRKVDGSRPDLAMTQVLEAVQLRLDQWRDSGGTAEGFPPHLVDYPDQFKLVSPADVVFDVWPQLLFCSNRTCGHVIDIGQGGTSLDRNSCLRCRSGRYRQLPYYRIHSCGKRQRLGLPRCDEHGTENLLFEDTGSFYTAQFRCGICSRPLGMPFTQCFRCTWGAAGRERTMTPVTARDSRAFFGHHITMINIPASRISAALNAPHGPHYSLGHYVRSIESLDGLIDESHGRVREPDPEAERTLQLVRESGDQELISRVEQMVNRDRGDAPSIEMTEMLLGGGALAKAQSDRRMMERALLFAGHDVDPLTDVAGRLRGQGHSRLAVRIDAGLERARQFGIERISVVPDFPIALVGFGFTRGASGVAARLNPLDADDDQLPLIAIDTRTEGLLVELDPMVLWTWASANGWTTAPEPENASAARAWVLNTAYELTNERDAAFAIRRVTHVFSHLLILALDRRSSFSANSASEYLLESAASFLIYVAKFTKFNLGGLIALAEQHLESWLNDAVDSARSCVHDPVCLAHRGGCHKCLAMAFGCERFNRGLDRGYLVGGGPQDIAEGYLYTAARHRTPATLPSQLGSGANAT